MNGCDITSPVNHNIPYLPAGRSNLLGNASGSILTKAAIYTTEMNYIKIFHIKRQTT